MNEMYVAWRNGTGRTDRRPIYDWAAEHITLPSVLSRQGHFNVSGSRHFIAPLDALKSDVVREVNILAPVRSGKSLIADIATAWALANDNASVLRVFATDSEAKEHAELRGMPMLSSCTALTHLWPTDRHKERTCEVVLRNGLPVFFVGPATSNLQAKGWKWVNCDEPWLYPRGRLFEAKARLGDFVRLRSSKFLVISQGGEEGDDWDIQFRTGVRHEWMVACLGCGKPFAPRWNAERLDGTRWGMVFDAVKVGSGYDVRRAIETMRVECPHCGHGHLDNERTRGWWNQSGQFVADGDTGGSRRSYHWNALIDYPWDELVTEWLAARAEAHIGNITPTIQFFQKRLAEPKSELTAHEGHQAFARMKIELDSPAQKLWPDEAARFLTVDRQAEDIYWATVRAWAKGTGESRRLWFGKLFSEADIEAIREKYGVPRNRVLIDSGYRPKGDQGVYSACIKYGWVSLKGDDAPHFWHHEPDASNPERKVRVMKFYAPLSYGEPERGAYRGRKCPLIRFSAPAAADKVQQLIENRLWVEPEDVDTEMEREYRVQMAAEFKRKFTNNRGRTEWAWVCPSGNNHAWDCAKMQVVGAWILGLI